MASFNNLRIGTRLIISMTILVVLLVIAISGIISYEVQRTLRDNTEAITQESAFHYAYIVKAELEIALDEARSLANVVELIVNTEDSSLSHRKLNDILKYFLEKHPKFFGIRLALESSDATVKAENTAELGYNSNGQFAPHWSREAGSKVNLSPLMNYETAPWYQLPQKNQRESIIDPTPYVTSQGEHLSLITLAVPLRRICKICCVIWKLGILKLRMPHFILEMGQLSPVKLKASLTKMCVIPQPIKNLSTR